MSILLPSVTTSIKKLNLLLIEANQSICLSLVLTAIKVGLLKRLGNLLHHQNFVLAFSFHSHFKLKRLHLLAPIVDEDVESVQNLTTNGMTSFMQAIKSKTSRFQYSTNTEDSGREVSLKALEDFLMKSIFKKNRVKRTRDKFWNLFYKDKALMAAQHWYLPICLKI